MQDRLRRPFKLNQLYIYIYTERERQSDDNAYILCFACVKCDGACGVHALFGSPELAINGGYELLARRARVVAVEHMGHWLEMLEQHSDVHQLVRDIKTIL